MRSHGIYPLGFLFVCNLLLLSPINVEASGVSRESVSYHNYLKGLLLDDTGDYEQARGAYEKAVNSDSEALDIHYRLALDYIRLRNLKKAEEEFGLILKSRPQDEKVRFLLAFVYLYREKYKEAAAEHLKLLQNPSKELEESDIRYSLAQVYFMQKDLARAEEEYKIILAKNPDDASAHFLLGYIYSESFQMESAISEFKRARELEPENPLILNSLSYLYAEKGQNLDEALILVQKALEFEPSNGAFMDTLGWVYFKKGDSQKAIKYLENASTLLKDAEIFEHLGDVYLKIGRLKEARNNWKKSLALDPKRKEVIDKIKNSKENK